MCVSNIFHSHVTFPFKDEKDAANQRAGDVENTLKQGANARLERQKTTTEDVVETTTTAKVIALQERTTKPAVIATLKPVVEPAKATSDVTKDDYVIYSRDYIHSFQRFGVGEARIKFLKEFQSPCFLENTTGTRSTVELYLITHTSVAGSM